MFNIIFEIENLVNMVLNFVFYEHTTFELYKYYILFTINPRKIYSINLHNLCLIFA